MDHGIRPFPPPFPEKVSATFPNEWIIVIVVAWMLAAVVWIFKTCMGMHCDDHQLISTQPALGNTVPTVNAPQFTRPSLNAPQFTRPSLNTPQLNTPLLSAPQFNRPSLGARPTHRFGNGENVEPGALHLHFNDNSHHIHHQEFNRDTHSDVTTSSIHLAEAPPSYREIMGCSSDTILHSSKAGPCSSESGCYDVSGD